MTEVDFIFNGTPLTVIGTEIHEDEEFECERVIIGGVDCAEMFEAIGAIDAIEIAAWQKLKENFEDSLASRVED